MKHPMEIPHWLSVGKGLSCAGRGCLKNAWIEVRTQDGLKFNLCGDCHDRYAKEFRNAEAKR